MGHEAVVASRRLILRFADAAVVWTRGEISIFFNRVGTNDHFPSPLWGGAGRGCHTRGAWECSPHDGAFRQRPRVRP
jgi:hypothetical protein